MPHWFEDALLALDLETTGLDPIEDRIVQAAVVLVGADGAVSDKSWDGIVDPGVPIPVGASNIHGITTERARQEGMPPVEALQIIARLVDNAADRGMPLVIFNAPFDWPFVLAEAQRHGVQIGTPDIVDPLVIDRAVDRYRKGIDAPICQDTRSGGLDDLLASAEIGHDSLVDFASEKTFQAPDDLPFGSAVRRAACDVINGRLMVPHADDDGSIEGGVGVSVAASIEAVPAGGHPGRGRDRTRAAALREGGFRTNPVGIIAEDDQQFGRGVGAHTEALTEGR